jgi:hypothetical protein
MFDETALVAGLAGQPAEVEFGPGERADGAGYFDQETPARSKQVHGQPAAPARHLQRAEHGEQDEAEMQQQDCIGKEAVGHAWLPSLSARILSRTPLGMRRPHSRPVLEKCPCG